MSVGSDSQSSSQVLSSSQASLNQSSKRASSEISRTYKHASQLYLTRRLVEAYEALKPVITAPGTARPDDSPGLAPIATATTSQRIKLWSLYVTLLNAIVELDPEDGKRQLGARQYRDLVRRVQDGSIWEEVVNDGYQGREGSVDAEVVYNLSNLLLGQAPNQKLNQARLETYLSSSALGDLNLSMDLSQALSRNHQPGMNGANTPKDLQSRIKILELFTLHVLPRNEEWDYAKTFIAHSDVLDEERREAFLATLEELQEVTEHESAEPADEETFDDADEEMHTPQETADPAGLDLAGASKTPRHQRTSSEVDYGIEEHPNGGQTGPPDATPAAARSSTPLAKLSPEPVAARVPSPNRASPAPLPAGHTQMSPPAQTPRRPTRKPKANPNTVLAQARHLFLALSNLVRNMTSAISKNPTTLLRLLLFVLAFVIAFSQRQIRDRARRLANKSWDRLRGTVGMGVKVSYI